MSRHDHRQSLWLIAGGAIAWCYQCGAWTMNLAGAKRRPWFKPTGIGGPNPAMLGNVRCEGGGRVSVPIGQILASPKVRQQIEAVRAMSKRSEP